MQVRNIFVLTKTQDRRLVGQTRMLAQWLMENNYNVLVCLFLREIFRLTLHPKAMSITSSETNQSLILLDCLNKGNSIRVACATGHQNYAQSVHICSTSY